MQQTADKQYPAPNRPSRFKPKDSHPAQRADQDHQISGQLSIGPVDVEQQTACQKVNVPPFFPVTIAVGGKRHLCPSTPILPSIP